SSLYARRIRGSGDWTMLASDLGTFADGIVLSPDSPLVVLPGPCPMSPPTSAPGEPPPEGLCWYDGTTWRTEPTRFRMSVIAARGSSLLVGDVGPMATADPRLPE